MPEATADALAREILKALPPERPHGRAALARLPLPIAHYLGGVLDRRLAREAALPASAWFDGDADAVQEAARAWRAATRDTARFPADLWADAAHEAARRVLGYLVTPAETLTAHVFADAEEEALPIEAVRARMAAFSPYPYLREIAEGYFARKGVEAVGRDDFERLLRRIDRRMVSLFGPHDWLSLLEPLFDLLRPVHEGGRVPAPLLRRFFEAKGYDDLAHALRADAYDEPALRATLADALPDLDAEEAAPAEDLAAPSETLEAAPEAEAPESEPEPEPEPEPELEPDETPEPAPEAAAPPVSETPPPPATPPARRAEPEPSAPEPEAAEPEAVEPESPEPLWLRLARRREEPAPEAPRPPEPAGKPAAGEPAAGEPEGEAEPLWKRFAAPRPSGPSAAPEAPGASRRPEPLARLETRVLGPSATERRDWYVTNLTGGSEAEYRAVLDQLDAAPSWTAASQIIAREVFRKHQVNIYSDAAVAFTDAAEARFIQGR